VTVDHLLELDGADRLGQDLLTARSRHQLHVLVGDVLGDEDDGDAGAGGVLFEEPRALGTAHPRHFQVKDDEVRPFLPGQGDGLGAGGGLHHLRPESTEHLPVKTQEGLRVVREQDLFRQAIPSPR
jgi:hypothetical protein